MAASDYVQFANDEDQRDIVLPHTPWPGTEWPPPERLGLLVGKHTGQAHHLLTHELGEVEAREHVQGQGVDFDKHFEVWWFRQVSASKISDADAAEMTHVARGAAYAREAADG